MFSVVNGLDMKIENIVVDANLGTSGENKTFSSNAKNSFKRKLSENSIVRFNCLYLAMALFLFCSLRRTKNNQRKKGRYFVKLFTRNFCKT
jgi:hypothetical protein